MLHSEEQSRQKITIMLMAVMAANIAYNYGSISPWIFAVCAVAMLWRLLNFFNNRIKLPSLWLRLPIYLALSYGVGLTYRGLFNRDAGVAMIVLAGSMQLLQPVRRGDIVTLVGICLLILTAKLLESQTAEATIFMVVDVCFLIGILYANQGTQLTTINFRRAFSSAFRILAITTPLLFLMFVFFPRLAGPLLPNPLATRATNGFSEELNPGSLASLMENNTLAFRVRFPKFEISPISERYWRGQEFSESQGMRWLIRQNVDAAKSFQRELSNAKIIKQEFIVEPGLGSWLFALDLPHRIIFQDRFLASKLRKSSALSYSLASNLEQRAIYQAESIYKPKYLPVSKNDLEPYLQIPVDEDKLAVDIVKKLKVAGNNLATIDNVMSYYASNEFQYSLDPGKMSSELVSEFLLRKKIGFCEHFAASMATLLRYAKIPSRVVVGFQGGVFNQFDGYYTVTGRDAHAWVEAWVNDSWMRYDPTGMVAPPRVQVGGQDFFAIPELQNLSNRNDVAHLISRRTQSLFVQIKLAIDAATNRWNIFLLQYNFAYQQRLLNLLGIQNIHAYQLLALVLVGLALFVISMWMVLNWRSERLDYTGRWYRKFLHHLSRHGVNRLPNEGALAFSRRLQLNDPETQALAAQILEEYTALRYSAMPPSIRSFAAKVRFFRTKPLKSRVL